MDYHNEFDPYAAQWIRNLMAAGLIPQGEVDERSIADVSPDDLRRFRRWHFFSGIGGWALALRLAGWPDDREICTGSAPCQPFSVAGKGKGTDDHRHLWPDFLRIIRTLRPAICMGEQVHAAARKVWLDGVLSDLEGIGYAGDAVSVPACAVNAPHRRDRLWWCAEDRTFEMGGENRRRSRLTSGELFDPASIGRREGRAGDAVRIGHDTATAGASVCDTDSIDANAHVSGSSEGRQQRSGEFGGIGGAEGDCSRVDADPENQRIRNSGIMDQPQGNGVREVSRERNRLTESGHVSSAWDHAAWIICHDGKARRVGIAESGIRRLADDGRLGRGSPILRTGTDAEITPLLAQGVKARVGKLRGFGNMIVPQVAAEMVRAYMDCRPN